MNMLGRKSKQRSKIHRTEIVSLSERITKRIIRPFAEAIVF